MGRLPFGKAYLNSGVFFAKIMMVLCECVKNANTSFFTLNSVPENGCINVFGVRKYMNILFTICGRAGSKGIKSKNVRDFKGKPLVYHSLSAIDLYLKSEEGRKEEPGRRDLVLSTDSPRLIELVESNPFMHAEIINRCDELSGDTVAKKDVILDCLLQMEKRMNCVYDMVVDLDITSPLRSKEDVANLIKTHSEKGADITYSVTTARRNPYFNQVVRGEKGFHKAIMSDYVARQQAPEVFDMNASLYAYRPDHLKNGGDFNNGYFETILMYDTAVLDLDHESDFELMEVIAGYLYENRPEFAEIINNIP